MFTPPNVSRATCHVSRVTCHVSHVMCHMSLFFSFFSDKVVDPIGGGSVINGATLSSFQLTIHYIGPNLKLELTILGSSTATVKVGLMKCENLKGQTINYSWWRKIHIYINIYKYIWVFFFYLCFFFKTRRGSPVDDRPSTDKLHHFVQKKNLKK